jgi:hypothetical protein
MLRHESSALSVIDSKMTYSPRVSNIVSPGCAKEGPWDLKIGLGNFANPSSIT